MRNLISKVFMTIVACLFCMQTALAADTWSYPSKAPDKKYGGGSGTAADPYIISTAPRRLCLHGEPLLKQLLRL